MMLLPCYDGPELALKSADGKMSRVCPAVAQPTGSETICPSPSKGHKHFFINNYSPKWCGLFFWTWPEVQARGPWERLETAQCPACQRGRRRGQPPAPHSLFSPPPPSPCPLTWSLSYRAWSGLRPAFPCQVDRITPSSAAAKGVRKIRGVGRAASLPLSGDAQAGMRQCPPRRDKSIWLWEKIPRIL